MGQPKPMQARPAQAKPTQDQPSMDEILSSIRRIIETSEPDQPVPATKAEPAAPLPDDMQDQPSPTARVERMPMNGNELDHFAQALDARAPGSPGPDSLGLVDGDGAEALLGSDMVLNGSAKADHGKYEARFSEDDSRAFAEVASVLSANATQFSAPRNDNSAQAASAAHLDAQDPLLDVEQVQDSIQPPARTVDAVPNSISAPVPATPLLSTAVQQSIGASFGDLAETLREHAGRDLETMTEDMLRPMLADWLDNNLPAMVERLVRAEIERIARGDPRQT